MADDDTTTLEVYWRDGCGFCRLLLRRLARAGITPVLHDIWADDEAQRWVRAHNRGNETVPTVALGDRVMTNPDPAALVAEIERDHPHLVGEPRPGLLGRALHR